MCREKFETWYLLKEHMLQSHTEHRPFSCHMCVKAFKTNSALQNHMLLHGVSVIAWAVIAWSLLLYCMGLVALLYFEGFTILTNVLDLL